MKIDLMNMIDTINAGIKKIKPLIKDYIKNKEYSLEDRWEVYSTVPDDFLDVESYYADYTFDGGEIVWNDDHYIDKYQTADNLNIIRRYEEKMIKGGYDYDPNVTQEKIDDLKEQMLQSGYRKWINNW